MQSMLVVASITGVECRVQEVHSAVNVGNHSPGAIHFESIPNQVSSNLSDVRTNTLSTGECVRQHLHAVGDVVFAVAADDFHFGQGSQRQYSFTIRLCRQPVENPERANIRSTAYRFSLSQHG